MIGSLLNVFAAVLLAIGSTRVQHATHAWLEAHDTTILTFVGGSTGVPLFLGSDEAYVRDLDVGNRFVLAGWLLMGIGFGCQVGAQLFSN